MDLHRRDFLLGSAAIAVPTPTFPWSWKAIYRDCAMSQKVANCKGRHLGRTIISGPVDLYGSMIQGIVIVNGRQVAHGSQGVAA